MNLTFKEALKYSGGNRDGREESIKIDDDNAREDFQPQQNRPLNFVEYHPKDRTAISFKDLCKKYSAQIDFQDQAKINFPNHAPERIFENLKKMAQWSLDKSNHTPQKWMTIWLDTFMKNIILTPNHLPKPSLLHVGYVLCDTLLL